MTAYTDFKLDCNNCAIPETSGGYTDLATITGAEVVSQNVKLRMLIIRSLRRLEPPEALDWVLFFNNKSLRPVLGTKIRALIANTPGVDSVDLSKAQYQLNPPSFTGLCFTVGCDAMSLDV